MMFCKSSTPVEVGVSQFADLWFNVARDGDIHQQHRLVTPRLKRTLHHALADDRRRAGGGADNDVGLFQPFVDIAEGYHLGAHFPPPAPGRVHGCGWRSPFCARDVRERWRATSSMVSPAPTSNTVTLESDSKICRARVQAAKATETALAPISVSVRTRLATERISGTSAPAR